MWEEYTKYMYQLLAIACTKHYHLYRARYGFHMHTIHNTVMPSTKVVGFRKISHLVTFDTLTTLDPTNQHYSRLHLGLYHELPEILRNIIATCVLLCQQDKVPASIHLWQSGWFFKIWSQLLIYLKKSFVLAILSTTITSLFNGLDSQTGISIKFHFWTCNTQNKILKSVCVRKILQVELVSLSFLIRQYFGYAIWDMIIDILSLVPEINYNYAVNNTCSLYNSVYSIVNSCLCMLATCYVKPYKSCGTTFIWWHLKTGTNQLKELAVLNCQSMTKIV